MAEKSISKRKLIDLLLKRASGFYFDETQCEYQKTQKSSILDKKHGNIANNLSFFDLIDTKSLNNNNPDDILYLNIKEPSNQEYILTKKKVITHYNPPDLQAIKILLDLVNDSKENDSLKNLSNDELLKLKNKLIEEISNEDNTT